MFLACLFNAALIQIPPPPSPSPSPIHNIGTPIYNNTFCRRERGGGRGKKKKKKEMLSIDLEKSTVKIIIRFSLSLSLSRFKREERRNSLRISSIDFKIVFDVELSLERFFFLLLLFFASQKKEREREKRKNGVHLHGQQIVISSSIFTRTRSSKNSRISMNEPNLTFCSYSLIFLVYEEIQGWKCVFKYIQLGK